MCKGFINNNNHQKKHGCILYSGSEASYVWTKVKVKVGIKVGIGTRTIKTTVIEISAGIGVKANFWAKIGRES